MMDTAEIRKLKKAELQDLVLRLLAELNKSTDDRVRELQEALAAERAANTELASKLSEAQSTNADYASETDRLSGLVSDLEYRVDNLMEMMREQELNVGRVVAVEPGANPPVVSIELPLQTYGSVATGYQVDQEVSVA